MNIDSHQHFWRHDLRGDGWITDEMEALKRDFLPGDLMAELAENGFGGSVAVQADQSEQETLFLLDLAREWPRIAGVVGWVDLRNARLPERLRFFSQFEKLRGFRHVVQSEADDRFLARDDFSRGIGCLKEFGFTYDILIFPKQLPAAAELVEKFPEQKFVIDHMAKPSVRTKEIGCWAERMRAIAANPNVYCKLSGLVTEADWHHWRAADFRPYLDVVFEAFGARRLMFGSDWPVCLLAGTYRQVWDLIADYARGLAPEEQEAIFGGNAIRFYGLEVS